MPIRLGKEPYVGGEYSALSELEWLQRSGKFEVTINRAQRKEFRRKDGSGSWQVIKIQGMATDGDTQARVGFSVPLPEVDEHGNITKNSKHLSALLYFLNLTDGNGVYELPDPQKFEGEGAYGHYEIYSYRCLEGARVWALLEYKGLASYNGTAYGTYDLKGFCDSRGLGVADILNGSNVPNQAYREFLKSAGEAGQEGAAEDGGQTAQAGFRPVSADARDRAANILSGNNRNSRDPEHGRAKEKANDGTKALPEDDIPF